MRRILSIITILLVAVVCNVKAEDEVQWTEVSTAEEFYDAIKSNHSANIKLMNDIDLSGLSVDGKYLFNFTFSGRISGIAPTNMNRNYGIKKLSHILFSKMDNANISDFAVVECSFNGNDKSSGQLADECNNSTISNVIFSGNSANGDVTGYDCDRMGGAVGKATDSHFLDLFFTDCKMITDGSYLGLVVGDAKNCEFSKCVSNLGCELWADGNLTSDNSAYAGGFCGYADKCTFTQCFNFGTVMSDDDRIGGIIGFGTNKTSITDCRNGGVVKHCRKEGFGRIAFSHAAVKLAIAGVSLTAVGLVSYAALYYGSSALYSYPADQPLASFFNFLGVAGEWYHDGISEVLNFLIYGTPKQIASIIVAAIPVVFIVAGVACLGTAAGLALYSAYGNPDEMGGIAGTLHNQCSVLRCTNGGPVECRDAYAGGIVGYLDGSTIESCYNRSFVKGSEYIAGIAGYVKNGIVSNCLSVGPASDDKSGRGGIDGGREGKCTLKNNYYLSDVITTAGGSTSFTQEQLPSGMIAKTLNDSLAASGSEKIWCQNLGEDFYPAINDTTKTIVETTTDNYTLWQKVYNASDFYLAAANPDAKIEIEKDIDLGNYYFNLASTSHPFKGTIKGNGHKLSNVNYQAEQSGIISEHENTAFFSATDGATIENLTLDSINITHLDQVAGSIHTEAILAAQSKNSYFSNITIRNSSIMKNSDPDYLAEVGGVVAISTGDVISGCTVESSCQFQGYSGYKNTDTNVGGIVSKAYYTTITNCHNAAKIWADDNQEGGIAAYAEDCTIANCLNTGGITGQENVGGICGNAVNTVISGCVNTAWIDDDESKREDKRSGIVGVLNGSKASVSYCLNFGSVNYADNNCAPINDKRLNGATYGECNYYYCQFNGSHIDNTEKTTDATYAKMLSGEFAYNNSWLYQDIDNGNFCTNLPVPIEAAGNVLLNYLCDGKNTRNFSNHMHGDKDHTTVEYAGICTLCGRKTADPENVTISTGDELCTVALAVNRGIDYSNTTFELGGDIDMTGITDYVPAGNLTHPFCSSFNGNGHRIKNLTLNRTNDGTGVFGYVGNNAKISNVIVDKSCTITSSAYYTAGLVGCSYTDWGSKCDVTIQNCGNEAKVNGDKFVGGIYGAVMTNPDAKVNILNCYNTGEISGTNCSAAIIGDGAYHTNVTNSWNSGSVTGNKDGYPFAGTYEPDYGVYTNTCTLTNCYDINSQNGVNAITANDLNIGILCQKLNENGDNKDIWGQDLGTDDYPTFSDAGLHHSRTMTNKYGTICLPFDAESNDSCTFYTISNISDDALTLTKVEGTLYAGTPAIVKRNDEVTGIDVPAYGSKIVTSPKEGSAAGGLKLTGTFTTKDISGEDGYFIKDNAFWRIKDAENKVSCDPFRAYLAGSLASGAESLAINARNVTDGITETLNSPLSSLHSTVKYLENGRVIIIKNSKKYNTDGQIIK